MNTENEGGGYQRRSLGFCLVGDVITQKLKHWPKIWFGVEGGRETTSLEFGMLFEASR